MLNMFIIIIPTLDNYTWFTSIVFRLICRLLSPELTCFQRFINGIVASSVLYKNLKPISRAVVLPAKTCIIWTSVKYSYMSHILFKIGNRAQNTKQQNPCTMRLRLIIILIYFDSTEKSCYKYERGVMCIVILERKCFVSTLMPSLSRNELYKNGLQQCSGLGNFSTLNLKSTSGSQWNFLYIGILIYY